MGKRGFRVGYGVRKGGRAGVRKGGMGKGWEKKEGARVKGGRGKG